MRQNRSFIFMVFKRDALSHYSHNSDFFLISNNNKAENCHTLSAGRQAGGRAGVEKRKNFDQKAIIRNVFAGVFLIRSATLCMYIFLQKKQQP